MHPHAIAWTYEAVLRLWRIATFLHRFSFGLGLMATCFHGRLPRETPRGIAISARKLAQMRADF